MTTRTERLEAALRSALGERVGSITIALGELTLVVEPGVYAETARLLRDTASLRFDTAVDLCGVDYSGYGDGLWEGRRFAVVVHLLSVEHNWRLRLRTFAADDGFPVVSTLIEVWPGLNWFEREAFDLFGIMFEGHTDLRRLLTDYGFIGHPFRKDFPLTGHVEMRYDPDQKRVIYQPVTIEPREITPRIIREEHYGEAGKH